MSRDDVALIPCLAARLIFCRRKAGAKETTSPPHHPLLLQHERKFTASDQRLSSSSDVVFFGFRDCIREPASPPHILSCRKRRKCVFSSFTHKTLSSHSRFSLTVSPHIFECLFHSILSVDHPPLLLLLCILHTLSTPRTMRLVFFCLHHSLTPRGLSDHALTCCANESECLPSYEGGEETEEESPRLLLATRSAE